jgi:membrane-associated phospholipid phosphatase
MTRPRTTLAAAVALAAVVVYAVMWVGYRENWGWLHSVDWSLLNAAHDIAIKHPVWLRFWEGVSVVLGPIPLRLLGMVAAVVALVKRNLRVALVLLACAPLNGLVTTAAKSLVNRPRPATALVAASSTSFPSGHALEATAALLALLTFLLPMISRWMGYVAVAVAAAGAVSVGIARVALNVHYPSDVLAGWALGYLYFLLCLWVFRPPPISVISGDERASPQLSAPTTPPRQPERKADTAR